MPRYDVYPVDRSVASTQIIAPDPASVLHMVERLECREADIFADGEYSLSIQLGDKGMWCIFQRSGEASEPI